MNNEVNETFSFGNEENGFDYNRISGLGESNYENEDLFNVEVSNENSEIANPLNQYSNFNSFGDTNNEFESQPQNDQQYPVFNAEKVEEVSDSDDEVQNLDNIDYAKVDYVQSVDENNLNESIETEEENEPLEIFEESNQDENKPSVDNFELSTEEETSLSKNVDDSYLDTDRSFDTAMFADNYNLPVVNPSVEPKMELSSTPISELEKLTHFEEEKIQTTDIKTLFDRVGVNVKEASDIFKKNSEMKEKIDSRFEELKKLQSEVERSKKSQYDEINSYKEEVLGKLTEKKEEIERRLNKLKEFQSSLEKEKQEFEQYRKTEKEEIEKVQKEVQEAYESRREELNHIEDVLRKQKDALDEERSQLSLDRIQYESDKNELANNLLKFNEIVDSFTNGMDKINKE